MTTLKKFVFCFFLPLIHEESWTFHQTTCWRFLLRKTQILICLPHAMTDVNVSGITTPLPVAALPLPHMLDNGLLPVECTGHKSFIVKCMKCVLKLNSKEWKLFADHRKRDTNSKLRIKCWLLSSNVIYLPNVLTGHAVEAKDQTDEALQCYDTRGGAVTQSHQIQHVIVDPLSWPTYVGHWLICILFFSSVGTDTLSWFTGTR